jgi:hypothetical protein
MRMTNKTKLFGAVAVAGVVAASGSAFTGAGATIDATSQFVGGTISQSVTGAHVTSVVYTEGTTALGTHTYQTSVALTFAEDHPTDAVTVAVDGSTTQLPCTGSTSTSFTCVLDGGTGTGVTVSTLAITAAA